MKPNVAILLSLATLVAWQKPRAPLTAVTGHAPLPLVLFDAQHPLQSSQMTADGASVYQVAGRLRIGVANPGDGYPSAFLLARRGHWDLSRYRYIEVDVHNVGRLPASVSTYAFVPGGFGGICTYPGHETGRELLRPGAQRTLRIDLHQRFPDKTETIDPRNVTKLQIILNTGVHGTMIDILRVRAVGQAPFERHDFAGRLTVPSVTEGMPYPGRRVYMTLAGSPVRYVLYLPPDWTPDGHFPVIAEYSGNIFYFKNTYSTGKADQGNIGYGMSKGKGVIWVNLPFLSTDQTREQLDGFGNLDATAEYARQVIHEVVEKYSGDPGAVFLTGFSRGGAACGYIGLHNDEIADVWLGFHAVAGGDGAGWFGSEMPGAIERGGRMKGRSSFVTDGTPWQDVLAKLRQPFTYMDSGIGAHVDTMFLDNRPSTAAVRKWMAEVLRDRPGVHDISGVVTDSDGNPVEGARVESGYTHFTLTAPDGSYTIRSLINGSRTVSVTRMGMHFEPRRVVMAGRHVTGIDFQCQ
ncbi:MAG TPA: carboxypeptidase regulatory-like domain-containing protein [Bryobacteraceae bacterium]